ncbi:MULTISPECIES: hypothetical protein [unclassified Rathayibacter]|uniref:hypothetical protein n=1 Tax=unclassified Rathayibacter TaxID=2609250 RepID=UPI0006FE6D49|nr:MULTISPECIES: hypothetical protein [unclassified Rathayibacter]KQQ05380.1 hypothetical protein ASF42_01930 [Rathayibacter sp. Leaf294]KQS13244.1 hypothetical protein ASG06_01940 [Rathayibacter sp. Leaf185]
MARAAAVAVLCLVLALAGCTVPPDGADAALASLVDRIRAGSGVGSVESSLQQADPKDRPDEWIASVDVTASGDDLEVAAVVRDAVHSGVTGTKLSLSLRIPAGDAGVGVVVDPRRKEDVELAGELRVLPFAESVAVSPYQRYVELSAGVSFTEAVAVVRTITRRIDLARGSTSIAVEPEAPGPALLALVDTLDADPRISSVTVRSSEGAERASVSVTTDDAEGVATTLAATPDEAADAGTAARTSFSVQSADYATTAAGWLGLPLGSPEPPLPTPPSLPEADPAEVAAGVAAVEPVVREFLEESVAATGVPAEVSMRVEPCSEGPGSRSAGSVVVPVFTVYDSAQEPFDAVIEGWKAAGFDRTDRASGRDFWTAVTPWRDGVVSASIRGTPDGVSLTAESGCVRG